MFVLSDFPAAALGRDVAAGARAPLGLRPGRDPGPDRGQSFPDVHGSPCRSATRAPAASRRSGSPHARPRSDSANERRYAGLLEVFRGLDLDPVLVSSSDPSAILSSFLGWSEARRTRQVVRA